MNSDESHALQANLKTMQVGSLTARKLLDHESAGCRLEMLPDSEAQLYYQDKPIYSGEQPSVVADGQSRDLLNDKTPDVIVFFGFGLGTHVAAMRRYSTAPIVVYEPCLDISAFVLSKVTVELADVYLVSDHDTYTDVMGSLLAQGQSSVVAGAIPIYPELFPAAFEDFKTVVNEALDDLEVVRKTRDRFSVEWVANLAGNLPFLGSHKSLSALGDAFAGKPAILVGAGPSLDLNMKELAAAKGRALIIAVHSAVISLSKAGIVPDLVVIIEGQELKYYFDDVPNLDQMVLLVSPQTHPEHLTLGFKDFLSLTLSGNAAADWLGAAYDEQPMSTGGSVACTTMSILHALGCQPIVFVGMDTAYSDTHGHAQNSETGCCEIRFDHETSVVTTHCSAGVHEEMAFPFDMVTAWGGEKQVATRPVLTSFRHWFEAAARTWAADDNLINATEGGARIRGFSEMTLAAVIAEYCGEKMPTVEMIGAALAGAKSRDPAALIAVVRTELEVIRQAGQAAQIAFEQAGLALEKINSRDYKAVQPLLEKLGHSEAALRELTLHTRLINTLVGHRADELVSQKATGDQVAQTIHSLEQSRRISQLVVDGARELLTQFEPALLAMGEEQDSQ